MYIKNFLETLVCKEKKADEEENQTIGKRKMLQNSKNIYKNKSYQTIVSQQNVIEFFNKYNHMTYNFIIYI